MMNKFNQMHIGKRLTQAFRILIVMFAVLLVLVMAIMIYMVTDYRNVLDNYAYPQGDIATAMSYSAEVRGATRGVIGYDSEENIETMMAQHEEAVELFEAQLEQIRPTMVTKAGKECMDKIDNAWASYKDIDAKVIELGATTDDEQSLRAQQMMFDEAAPVYASLDEALEELMAVNVEKGSSEETFLSFMLIVAIVVMIVVIVASTIFSNRLSASIAKGISAPLQALRDRFNTFADGDLDSPLPVVETKDEVAELVATTARMSRRIGMIIKDMNRLLNEMANGNFAIRTECEEDYVGAYNGLLMAVRAMNRQIDKTIRGVSEASEQVLGGATNLAEASMSVAEGATDQAAAVEEMQATIDELSTGIRETADGLGNSYEEAHRYAGVAESGRSDMEALMSAMTRISETSEKIGEIIAQIEDIASQTNLLSLNASIEAARAGDAGRGFAVVADQIRTLAEQSAKSAVDSKELIEASIYEVGIGNASASKASDSLQEIVEGVYMIAETAKKMKEISEIQAVNMEQADAAVAKIAEVVQNNSASAEETSATSEELNAQATALDEMIAIFKLRD